MDTMLFPRIDCSLSRLFFCFVFLIVFFLIGFQGFFEKSRVESETQWYINSRNWDIGTRPLADPLARSLAPLTRSLARWFAGSLRSRAHSLTRAHSLAPETVGQWNNFVQFSKCPESLCERGAEKGMRSHRFSDGRKALIAGRIRILSVRIRRDAREEKQIHDLDTSARVRARVWMCKL